jgi:hypothetical protein
MVKALFDESELVPAADAGRVSRYPDQHKPPFTRLKPAPAAAVRAACTRSMRGAAPRPRLGVDAFRPVLQAMEAATYKLVTLFIRGHSGVPVMAPELDDERISSRFLRLSTGAWDGPEPAYNGHAC